jgi:predicted ATPase
VDGVLEELRLVNFRCFRDARTTFRPLTVVVGGNASGKSALLDALNPAPQLTLRDVWFADPTLACARHFRWNGKGFNTLRPAGEGPASTPALPFGCHPLRLDMNRIREPRQVSRAAWLETDGGNLVTVFDTLTRREQEEVAREVATLVPVIADVDTEPVGPGEIRLRFQDRWKPDLWHAPTEVSDGTMIALALILLQYELPGEMIITIEEIERGLHPYLLGEVMRYLRTLTERSERRLQIVAATHSPEVLAHVEPEEVRFLRRTEDGSAVIEEAPTGTPQWRAAYEEYERSLGGMWLSGGLGGVPAGP